jgi:hypothetical protein
LLDLFPPERALERSNVRILIGFILIFIVAIVSVALVVQSFNQPRRPIPKTPVKPSPTSRILTPNLSATPSKKTVVQARDLRSQSPLIADGSAIPLDMRTHVRTKAEGFANITAFPSWQLAPTGFQSYHNIPFYVDGFFNLWGPHHKRTPEYVEGIEINQAFETLYVFHGTWYDADEGVPVYDIVFRYEDEAIETDTVLYGTDVLDWNFSYGNFGSEVIHEPTGPRARLGWHSEHERSPGTGQAIVTDKKYPICFCITAIENPRPTARVSSLDFVTRKSECTAVVMALTIGKSGLMAAKASQNK